MSAFVAQGGSPNRGVREEFLEKPPPRPVSGLASFLIEERQSSMSVDIRPRTVLRSRIAKIFAAAIIVLAILPFTAPFSTFAVAEIASERILHSGAAQLKLVEDTTTVAFISMNALDVTLGASVDSVLPAALIDGQRVRALVLRI
jgi:hypothetical protein